MNKPPCVIMLEFNELCPALMDRFMREGHLPNFRKLYQESEAYTTDAEEEGDKLNPWVQWVTVHSGLSANEHKIHTLSEGHLLQTKSIWDLISDAGYRVWICGSMNPRSNFPLNGFLLPDPWSTGIPPQPKEIFDVYDRYVRFSVQEHTSQGSEHKPSARAFLKYMWQHGLSVGTALRVVRQLLTERFRDTKWKRVAIMDHLQWDLYRFIFQKSNPQFSTFFLNSTAHLQHCYWRNMEPERFRVRPSDEEQRKLGGAVLFGYQNMDRLIKRFMKLADGNATLIFCTALSQQPYLDHEDAGGRHYFRLLNKQVLTRHLGIKEPFAFEPLMAEQFYLRFGSAEEAQHVADRLRTFHVKDQRVFEDQRTRLFHLTVNGDAIQAQCRCTRAVDRDVVITAEDTPITIPFFDVFYEISTLKSGRHHRDGMLWVRSHQRRHAIHKERISIRCIAPMILKMFDLQAPSYMSSEDVEPVWSDKMASVALP